MDLIKVPVLASVMSDTVFCSRPPCHPPSSSPAPWGDPESLASTRQALLTCQDATVDQCPVAHPHAPVSPGCFRLLTITCPKCFLAVEHRAMWRMRLVPAAMQALAQAVATAPLKTSSVTTRYSPGFAWSLSSSSLSVSSLIQAVRAYHAQAPLSKLQSSRY